MFRPYEQSIATTRPLLTPSALLLRGILRGINVGGGTLGLDSGVCGSSPGKTWISQCWPPPATWTAINP